MRDFKRNELQWCRKRLLQWYEKNGRSFPWRNRSATLYERVVSELLLQRTRAETVASFHRDFVKHYPSWSALAQASLKDLRRYLRSIGIWRRRAKTLMDLSRVMKLRRGRFPKTREEIESLPGVGQYVANAILMFTSNGGYPLLDTNMARVLERYLGPRQLADIRYDPKLQEMAKRLTACDQTIFLNWAVLDLAALICTKNGPQCPDCPLTKKCDYHNVAYAPA